MVEATEAARSAAEVSGSASLWDMTVRSFDMPGQAVMLIAVRERVRAPEAAAWEDAPRLDRSSDVPGSPALEEFGGAGGGSRIKQQKTSGPAVAKSSSAYDSGNKSFLVPFFKKEPLALPCLASQRSAPADRQQNAPGKICRAAPACGPPPRDSTARSFPELSIRTACPPCFAWHASCKSLLETISNPKLRATSLRGSLDTAVGGLNAQSAAVSKISDTLANSQTICFKSANTNFID